MAAIHEMARELTEIARLCCEATGETRGTRSALECVTAALENMRSEAHHLRERLAHCTLPWCDVPALQREVAELRRYDARELLRCPECGSDDITLSFDNAGHLAWFCRAQERRGGARCPSHRCKPGTWRATPLAALLAWHGRDER